MSQNKTAKIINRLWVGGWRWRREALIKTETKETAAIAKLFIEKIF